jgi:hypothetical protein
MQDRWVFEVRTGAAVARRARGAADRSRPSPVAMLSAHWLGPANRCLVPFTSFCEYADTKPKKTPVWFAAAESRPLLFGRTAAHIGGLRGERGKRPNGYHEQ